MDRDTRHAITRLIDTFGADIALDLPDRPTLSTVERARARLAADEMVEGCTACPLHILNGGDTPTPLTPYWSPAKLPRAGRVAVLTDAPTYQEHKRAEMGHGPVYSLVRQAFRDNDITTDRISYLPLVACTTLVHDARRGTRRTPPSRESVNVCLTNALRSLDAADVEYVLLLGDHAVRAWRPDLRLTDIAGRWYVWQRHWLVWPVEHPRVMFDRRTGSKERTEWLSSLSGFCRGVNGGVGLEALSSSCVRDGCTDVFYAWDDDGVPWCRAHLKPGRLTREARAANKRGATVDPAQQTIL